MSLYRESTGSGPDVALLHGWGLHGGVFSALASTLSEQYRVHVLDLPGHGHSPWSKGAGDLEGMARLVAAHLPERCALVGWSLGGLVAQHLSTLFPNRVSHLVMISTGVVGVRRRDFPHAADPSLLAGLSGRLARDWRGTVLEFLNIEVRGDENPLETLRTLRQHIDSHGAPNGAALAAGLEILRSVDLRNSAKNIASPTLVIAGEYDRITPPLGVQGLAERIPGARYCEIKKAAHAPFLSQRVEVESLIKGFLGQ
jgi:pimeloyl-[acyl-carrier protein] methyl ester esterase